MPARYDDQYDLPADQEHSESSEYVGAAWVRGDERSQHGAVAGGVQDAFEDDVVAAGETPCHDRGDQVDVQRIWQVGLAEQLAADRVLLDLTDRRRVSHSL